ncbi:MAG: hypothetical protein AMQ22_00572 [Candidatus Methanofastidiosum methylothiophilum]|uniref:Uncharacterized protein n=1 Tax=Candidatus Methanofastidiosum methylothiophilum TaxID=1705564 RepID=A0A150J6G3_9EURY|nr:MAG: hypothetical protein AMQ22_00572 [Candidatus Methanofastidiosum methylthiophilus]
MNSYEINEMMLSIHKDLEETIRVLKENYNVEHPFPPQIKIIIYDGHWMGEIFPSLVKFPFGETIITHGFSAKDLEELLDKMKTYSSKQLENTKNGMIDSIPLS